MEEFQDILIHETLDSTSKISSTAKMLKSVSYFLFFFLSPPPKKKDFESAPQDRLITVLKQAVCHQIESSRAHPRIDPKITTLLEDYHAFLIPNVERKSFVGHTGNVKCIEFVGLSGRYLASGSR